MQLKRRIARAAREMLGLRQWPRPSAVRITNMDEFFLAQLVRPGDVVFDIGANHGQLACFIAQLCGDQGKVIAFEPVWRVYERMCERLQSDAVLRAPIVTVPVGLSDHAGVATIHYPKTQWGDCLATIAPIEKNETRSEETILQCGVIPLDLFMSTTHLPVPDLVKIDVEGAECKVLAGGRALFEGEAQPILLIELFGPWLRRCGNSLWDALGYLQKIGYTHFFMCPDGLIRHTASRETPVPAAFRMGYNVVSCVPSRHQDAIEALCPFLADRRPHLPPMDPPPCCNE